jgi:ribosomal protein S18 acetylase RimI-like enzyme/SAM-dependent methyltransferase
MGGVELRPFVVELAGTVASWAGSPSEAAMWCGHSGGLVPAEKVAGWSGEDGVRAFGLYAEEELVAYGELWVDDDEVELARLIVDPARRGKGVGRVLVKELTEQARKIHADVFMRVHPDNAAALRCYAAARFTRVAPELEAEWNAPQPVQYVWLAHAPDAGYLLDNAQREAGARFGALGEILDPVTFRHMADLGVGAGWRCWEVGAGGATVPRWLAGQVGATGRVLATDIDVSWLAEAAGHGVEVARHDVGSDDAPAGEFDLVHARLVLVHVRDRARALRSMVGALRPGGWLLLEDADPALQPLICPDEHGPEQELANRLRHGFRRLLQERGADLAYGRTLPRLLREAGLADVQADAYFPMTSPACDVLEAATVRQVRDRLIEHGYATAEEIERHLVSVEAGRLDLATAPMISAWGRRNKEG